MLALPWLPWCATVMCSRQLMCKCGLEFCVRVLGFHGYTVIRLNNDQMTILLLHCMYCVVAVVLGTSCTLPMPSSTGSRRRR